MHPFQFVSVTHRAAKWDMGGDLNPFTVRKTHVFFHSCRLSRIRALFLLQAWSWLGTNSETANSIYARFLPKNSYIVSRGGGEDVLPLVGSLTGKVGVGLREDENGLITTVNCVCVRFRF